MKKLRAWLEEENCRHAAMESTGVYWQPVYNVLGDAFDGTMVVMVVNARNMRKVPGKKTDMKDAEDRPAAPLQSFRRQLHPNETGPGNYGLTRYRKPMVEEISSQKNRIEKFLQSADFKLSTFCADVFGVSGRAIMEHLAHCGSIYPSQVESLLKGRLRVKRERSPLPLLPIIFEGRCFFKLLIFGHSEQFYFRVNCNE